jgi:hypothetical protein
MRLASPCAEVRLTANERADFWLVLEDPEQGGDAEEFEWPEALAEFT